MQVAHTAWTWLTQDVPVPRWVLGLLALYFVLDTVRNLRGVDEKPKYDGRHCSSTPVNAQEGTVDALMAQGGYDYTAPDPPEAVEPGKRNACGACEGILVPDSLSGTIVCMNCGMRY